jgi:hypothetical protein
MRRRNAHSAVLPLISGFERDASSRMRWPGIICTAHLVVMRQRLFNCEVITLVIASYLISLGVLILAKVFISPAAEKTPVAWEYYGFLSLAMGLVSGGVFWLIRRLLNKQ